MYSSKNINTLQMSFDSFDDTQIKKKVDKETADLQRKNCWVNTTIIKFAR
jgi:hypothetical protein